MNIKHLLLIFIFFSLISPSSTQAVCHNTTMTVCSPSNFGCKNMVCLTCRNSSNAIYACCDNNPTPDTCPALPSIPPAPTTASCGADMSVCCFTGTACKGPNSKCYSLPQYGGTSFCLTPTQYSELFKALDLDKTNLRCNGNGIRTALGCIDASNPKTMVNQLVALAVSVGGGAALIVIIYAGFTMTTAQGDMKKVASAKTWLMSAIFGLIVIVVAVVILNFVGINIFNLNSLGFGV